MAYIYPQPPFGAATSVPLKQVYVSLKSDCDAATADAVCSGLRPLPRPGTQAWQVPRIHLKDRLRGAAGKCNTVSISHLLHSLN